MGNLRLTPASFFSPNCLPWVRNCALAMIGWRANEGRTRRPKAEGRMQKWGKAGVWNPRSAAWVQRLAAIVADPRKTPNSRKRRHGSAGGPTDGLFSEGRWAGGGYQISHFGKFYFRRRLEERKRPRSRLFP